MYSLWEACAQVLMGRRADFERVSKLSCACSKRVPTAAACANSSWQVYAPCALMYLVNLTRIARAWTLAWHETAMPSTAGLINKLRNLKRLLLIHRPKGSMGMTAAKNDAHIGGLTKDRYAGMPTSWAKHTRQITEPSDSPASVLGCLSFFTNLKTPSSPVACTPQITTAALHIEVFQKKIQQKYHLRKQRLHLDSCLHA